MDDPTTIPCIGDPNFVLYEGSRIIIQCDDVLPPRLKDYLNDTMGEILMADTCSESRLIEIETADPTIGLKSLYSNRTLFRYTHKYFVYQDILDELNWSAIEQLADRLKVDLKVSTLRLSIYPKNFLDSVLDLLDEHAINFHPTRYSHILSILRYTDGTTKKHAYRIGFSPYGSALDHDNAFKLLQDESHISRAYYKIQEACDRCGVKEWPQPTWNALDIGAAPGGWSMYLSQVVGTVYAVDPAELAISKPNVIHLRAQLQQVIPQVAEIPFHMIVCDMNDDPIVAIQCIASVIDRLVIGGRIILTFKYPKRAAANIQKRLHADVELFKKELPSCDVERTMHMVSNHHERTLVAIKTRN